MMRQYELVERVRAYDPTADEEALNRAYVFALKAHGSQMRASGDPYFSHPVEVAGILTRMRLDTASVVTGLLHDVVEDTGVGLEEIDRLFGPDVARLVDGVTKLSRIELQSDHSKQAENFRKLVLAMSEDIRVLLVKLADRLHNMRTLGYIPDAGKRRRIAAETLEIYAPLAERIGIQDIKDELEDLAFAELNGEVRASILARLDYLRDYGSDLVGAVVADLRERLAEGGIASEVTGREKSPYSIWRKMQRKNVEFEQLSDIMAFRVLVSEVEDCYAALGVIHGAFPVVPGRFKDYISTPKANGYRSLHSGVFGPRNRRIEVQIRTPEMERVAEFGVAAHWEYKQGAAPAQGKQYRWLRGLLDILDQAAGPEEFLEHTKLEMFRDEVFCFTPKGELFALPRGATVIDFAYAVHSEIGDTCNGARVNGRNVQLRSLLQNGDQVEIETKRGNTPNPDWEKFVVTGRAKSRIRRFARVNQRGEHIKSGRQMLTDGLSQLGLAYGEKPLQAVLERFRVATVDDLLAAVGQGNATVGEVIHAAWPRTKPAPPPIAADNVIALKPPRRSAIKPRGMPLAGLIPGLAYRFAQCCHPLKGDRIVGIVKSGQGVTIHTSDCPTLAEFQDRPERFIDVSWEGDADEPRTGRITLVVQNEPGSMGELCTLIGRHNANISNLKITGRSADFFDIMIDVEVADLRHLTTIIAALRAMPVISSVDRARG
jgi:GTP pyrophosphokinase